MIKRELQKILSIGLVIAFLIMFFYIDKGVNDILVSFSLVLFYIYFFASVSRPILVTGNILTYFKIDVFFLLFYYIIYYYPYQLYLFGYYDLYSLNNAYSSYVDYTNNALLLSNIGLVCFMIGFTTKDYNKKVIFNNYNTAFMINLSWLFFILTIATILVFLSMGGIVMFVGSYAGSDVGDVTSNAVFGLISLFGILGGIQGIYIYYRRKKLYFINKLAILILLIWALMLLFLGDRNSFFIIAIAIAGGIYTFIVGISRFRIALLVVVGLFVYNIVETSRTLNDKSFDNIVENVLDENNKETGSYGVNSFNTTTVGLRSTFAVIPEKQDLFWGKFKLVSLTTIIPYSSRLFFDSEDKYLGSATVLKEEMIGLNAGWGVGTNILSDIYMDFGVFGVMIFMLVIGYFGGYIKNTVIRNPLSVKYFFLYILVLGYYSELARYGIDFPLRSIIWTLIIFGIAKLNQKKLIK